MTGSSFPTSLDSFSDPSATSKLNSPTHSQQHINTNDAIEKIQAKVGVNSSAVTTTHDFKLSGVATGDKAMSKTGEETGTNKTFTTPVIASFYQDAAKTKLMTVPDTTSDTFVTLDAQQELANKTLNNPTIKPVEGYAPTTAGLMGFNDTTKQLVYGNGTSTITVGQQYRAFSWYLDGTSIDGLGGPKYIAPQDMTVVKVYGILTSGTCTATIKKGSTTIDAIACSNTLATETSITDDAITAGDVITLTLSSSSSPVGLTVVMECLQS